MRATLRLLASVKPSRYLEPFAPTGLTGLTTHPSPRPALIYLYSTTLDKLKGVPESSVYRQATEALTKHRLNIVQSIKPPGYEAWLNRVREQVKKDPDHFKPLAKGDGTYAATRELGPREAETRAIEGWDEEFPDDPMVLQSEEEVQAMRKHLEELEKRDNTGSISWEPEPSLEATQISEIENQIGAGLIEEVIEVAQGEMKLVDEMVKSKVWEELEEKPRPGQWTYFQRNSGEQS